MGSIYLIRHGQASLGAANYDVLSPLGIRQSQLCGEHFGALGLQFLINTLQGPPPRSDVIHHV